MAGIPFTTIVSAIRTNTHHIEFNADRALEGKSRQIPHKILVMGIKLSTGSVAELIPKRVLSADAADGYWGVGSQIAEMCRVAKLNNPNTEMWGVGIDELTGGTAGTTTLTVGGSATAAGTIHLYIAGIYIPVAVASGDASTAIATAIDTAIKAHSKYARMPFTSGAAASVVTLTMRWKGVDQSPVVANYNNSDELPAGVTLAIATGVAGAGNPDVDEILTAIGSVQYDTILNPWNDATNLTALETELTTRYGGMNQNEGHAFSAFVGTHANATTLGNGRNSRHNVIMAANESPSPHWNWAAAVGAVDAGETHPARPRQTLQVLGVLPAIPSKVWSQNERNLLLYDGLATHIVDGGGNVYIERLATTYQTNALSVEDPTFLDTTTLRTLYAIRYSRRTQIALDFPRHLLAADGGEIAFGPGVPVATPLSIKAHGLKQFRQWVRDGWAEADLTRFTDEYTVIIDPADPNRVQEQMSPNLMNQFRGLSGQVQFLL